MSQDITSVTIVGRLTKDAELKYTNSGTAQSRFSVASGYSEKKGESWEERVSYFDLNLWGTRAEKLTQYLTKGQQVVVTGQLRQRRWEKDGQTHSQVGIQVEDIQLVGSKPESRKESNPSTSQSPNPDPKKPFYPEQPFEDDIPF